MKRIVFIFISFCLAAQLNSQTSNNPTAAFRPPSVPLVTHDPYFSIWSPADRLTDMETVHWTGTRNPMHSMIRIDGQPYRIMGSAPSNIEPIKQISLSISPTRSVYEFSTSKIKLTLSFL